MSLHLGARAANPALLLGIAGLLGIVIVALFGERLAPLDPQAWRIVEFYDGRIVVPPSPPDGRHLLGTDPLGRDLLSRLLAGARLSLSITVSALLLRVLLGIVFGALLAVSRGRARLLLTGVIGIAGAYPQLMLALLLGVALHDLGVIGFVLALGLVGWPEISRFLALELLRIGRTAYVEAAKALGVSWQRLALAHVGRNALPQLVGVLALESASVLLLLAELGFMGLFVAGSVSFSDAAGRPVLPMRDRAPEWGQMLAGAVDYVTSRQWVVYVPALVVITAVFVMNLLGEGLRAALDPRSPMALPPRALGWAGRGLLAVLLIVSTGFVLTSVQGAKGLTYDDGLALARAAAERERPGSVLVASVIRFSSDAHGLDRPEKLNYYFVDPAGAGFRVGYVDADALHGEFRALEDDDDIGDYVRFQRVGAPGTDWRHAFAVAESSGGNLYRLTARSWMSRIVLRQSSEGPMYRVRYGGATGAVALEVAVNGSDASSHVPLDFRLGAGYDQMLRRLDGDPALIAVGAMWSALGLNGGFGSAGPAALLYDFARSDRQGTIVRVTLLSNGTTQVTAVGQTAAATHPVIAMADPPLQDLFREVDGGGGRQVREEWQRSGLAWSAHGSFGGTPTPTEFVVVYTTQDRVARFSFDLVTRRVTRLP
jgi:ABC-type dipeptide/oligopeptide/nickel transport system permease subunit